MTDGSSPGVPTDALDVLAVLGRAVTAAEDVEGVVRPVLSVLAQLTGMESLYLARVDWDEHEQPILFAHNEHEGFRIEEGAVYRWEDTLCRRSLAEGAGWNTDVPGTWGDLDVVADIGVTSYVSSAVQLDGDDRPFGTLCAISPRPVEADPAVEEALALCASIVATELQRRRQLDEARARAARAEQRLRDRVAFGAELEHAMRGPLGVISGWALVIRARLGEDTPEDLLTAADAIARNVDRVTDQLTELLRGDHAVATADGVRHLDVADELADVLPLLGEDHPVRVEGELSLTTSPAALHLLLEHLLGNADAHTPDGTAIAVTLSQVDGTCGRIVVEDAGPGLPPRDDLFEPFVTIGDGGTSGLGLHIVAELVRELGGEVVADRGDLGGARFTVDLPLSAPTA